MTRAEFQRLVAMDLHRYGRCLTAAGFARAFAREPGFRITFLMRLCAFLRSHRLTRFGTYHLFLFWFSRCSVRFGVHLDFTTRIGGGLYIPHPCAIIVNRRTVIGENCNLGQNVTIGISNRGPRKGTPSIGNRVFIGPGAVIAGRVHIGDRCAIGANSVVLQDAPEGTVIAGVPGRVVSDKGSDGYINDVLGDEPPRDGPH